MEHEGGGTMIRRLILLVYTITLFVLAVIPPVPVPVQAGGLGLKLHHVAAFFVLTLLIRYGSRINGRRPKLAATVLLPFTVGVAIEAVQLFIPYRSGRLYDLISNSAGIVLALVVVAAVEMWKRGLAEPHNGPSDDPS